MSYKQNVYRLLGILLFAGSPFLLQAQLLDPVHVTVSDDSLPDTLASGEPFLIDVYAEIEPSWYLYSIDLPDGDGPIPTSFSTSDASYRIDGDIKESDAVIKFDPNFDKEMRLHSDQARFSIPIRFNPVAQGVQEFSVNIHYQACDDRSCLPPRTKTVTSVIELIPGDNQLNQAEFDGEDKGVGTISLHDRIQISEDSDSEYSVWGYTIYWFFLLAVLAIVTSFVIYSWWKARLFGKEKKQG